MQLDLPELEKKICELGDVLLVIIDPITSYLGRVDSHRNAELRSVLEPLGEVAARLGVTVLANTYLSKATTGNANNRVIGSVAFVNQARAAFILAADKNRQGEQLPARRHLIRTALFNRSATKRDGDGRLKGERVVPLHFVRGDTRTGWQLQHGRVLTSAQLCQQHDLPVGELQRIMMGVGPIVVDLAEPSHLVPGLAPGAE